MDDGSPVLDGIRVVEAASMVMVPSAAAVMSDYGAEVIKVEPLEGEINRRGHHIPGMPSHEYEYCFLPDNRNKRGLALDLKSEEGKEILHRLVERADVFFSNHRPKALARLGLTYEQLKERNPRLIYAQGTGFGDRGPEVDKPGFDSICYWSRSALEASMFPLDGWLGPLGYGTGDHPSGMSLFGAVMLALFARERTGRGCRVTTSLLANGAWSNAVIIQARLCEARFHERRPREEARNFTGVYYRAGDGRIFKLAVVNIEQGWPRVCRAIGRPDLIDHPRFATAAARAEEGRMPELVRICDEIFAAHDIRHWQRAFEENDVPFSVVSSYDDVVNDRQMAANDVFVEVEDPELGTVRTVNSPISLNEHQKVRHRAAPRLGEHSRGVLRELGYSGVRIEELVARGVVGVHGGA